MPQVLIVSNRLPVSVKKEDGRLEFYPSVGGLATGLSSYVTNRKNKWIGWPGISSDQLTDNDKHEIASELAKHNCVPVFLTRKQLDYFYNGYSNSVLWPLFHNLKTRPAEHHKEWWRAYRTVNKLFADSVLAQTTRDSAIWIHDYQLLLLPELIRREHPSGHIGFFLHIPFPNHKTFRQLPEAGKLLQGVLGADLVGFHTAGYVNNFLDNCQRLGAGVVTLNQILVGKRLVRADDFPMGIDYEKYAKSAKTQAVKSAVKKYKKRYAGRKLIVAVDRLDPSKGLLERLKAYKLFLEQNPKLRGRVVLSMVAAPSRTEIGAYQQLKQRLDKLVANINTAFGTPRWQPVDYINVSLPFEEVTALFQLADVAFIAPLRDGMNLVAKEFVASKQKDGVLILSETAGAAQELQDALLVDPRQPATVVAALQDALTMPRRELRQRLKRMKRHLSQNTVHTWAGGFMKALNQPVPNTPRLRVWLLNDRLERQLAATYRGAEKRLLLLDYDGTLTPFKEKYDQAKPAAPVYRLIKKLCGDQRNTVVLVSGRAKDELQAWFGDLPLSIVAEHGAVVKKAANKSWQTTSQPAGKWKREVAPVLQHYAGLTPRAAVEEKSHSLVWHYRQASPYHAQKNIVAIKRTLAPVLKRYGLKLFSGNKILEIKDPHINKGEALEHWVKGSYDFILAVGDDYTDEDMFDCLPPGSFSVKVGRGRTNALYRVGTQADVIAMLQKLAK